jgi:uncharacterized protein YciW
MLSTDVKEPNSMTTNPDVWHSTAVATSGATSDSPAGAAIAGRANILQMTQATEDAVLRPSDPGAWSHDLRAALAGRISQFNGCDTLVTKYGAMCQGAEYATLIDPQVDSADKTISAALTFVDQVATQPRDIAADDIKMLQAATIADADIVRLTEIVAFMAYQVRLTAGLALLAEMKS